MRRTTTVGEPSRPMPGDHLHLAERPPWYGKVIQSGSLFDAPQEGA
jgi:hypothetical protein